MNSYVLETQDLKRHFGDLKAVDGLNLKVPTGCIYGFLGPNGAGKTTTIRMLLGLIRPSAGKIQVFGRDLDAGRAESLSKIGALVETPSYYPHLSGRENVDLIRRMRSEPKSEVEHALKVVGLSQDANRPVKQYSLGMRQRLGLAMALLGEPELLILDEPTNGLDPAGIYEIRDLIYSLPRERGISIFLSSHLLNEVQHTADHIGIVQKGRLIFQGRQAELNAASREEVVLRVDNVEAAQICLERAGWKVIPDDQQRLLIAAVDDTEAAAIAGELVQARVGLYELARRQPSLEDIFLRMTGPEIEKIEEYQK
jgi:lantibiotic transport system ATP-binding protein